MNTFAMAVVSIIKIAPDSDLKDKEKECINLLKKCDDAYYNDEGLINDILYDEVKERVKKLFPNNSYFKDVGSSVMMNKVKHEYPMLSLDKCKTMEEVLKWCDKIGLDESDFLIFQPKIDGVSGSNNYNKENLVQILKRGNGKVGQDITHIKKYVNGLKEVIEDVDNICIRGEFYIPKSFKGSFSSDKPLRNICSGFINRKENLEEQKSIHFIAYQVFGKDFEYESDKMIFLKGLGFKIPEYFLIKKYEIEKFYNRYLKEFRDYWPYETDGIVLKINNVSKQKEINSKWIVNHHEHHQISLKPPPKSEETTLKNIEWQISRNGRLIPVAVFEPIIIDNSEIRRCTLHNYETVVNHKLYYENKIIISKAGEIIPYFERNLHYNPCQKTDIIPDKCPCCGNTLITLGVNLICDNNKCDEQQIQKIIYYIQKAEMEGVSEQTIRTLYEKYFIDNILDLYSLKEVKNRLIQLDGFGEKKVNNLLEQIEKSKNVSIINFLDRLGIEDVGKKSLKKLNIKTIQNFIDFNDPTYVIGQRIIEWKNNEDNIRLFNNLISILNTKEEKINMNGKKVCMTGKGHKGRKELIKDIEEKGDEFVSSITKDTNILICEDVNGNSSKLEKARKLGIILINYQDYFS